MSGILTITLLDLRFFAYHGWYEQESRQGQIFRVDLWVSYPEPNRSVSELDQTIDYSVIYAMLHTQMHRPRRLLEELAQSILAEIKEKFPVVMKIQIHIQKVAPPVAGLDGRLGIQLESFY
jgi:dihydroneopterin aldolase